jgi:DNA polymerase (family 10)
MREAWRAGIPAHSLTPVGSLRRCAPDVGDVAILAVSDRRRHGEVLRVFGALPSAVTIDAQTSTGITIDTGRGAITLCLSTPDQAGAALLWHTGTRRHTAELQARAARLGLRFANGRLTRGAAGQLDVSSEEIAYRCLDLPYIAPELREDGSEIDAAERGALPRLIGKGDIRGDLHMHSTWSDGRDTIAAMVEASEQLGYQYVAITDHSQRAFASRKLAVEDIARQREDIESVRAERPGVTILHGVEVDILKDGTLDFDDDLLAAFDIVLASLHDHGGQEPAELAARYMRAIEHPLVNVITHPANRAPGHNQGYELDWDALFAAAARTGTAMEVDGAPGHLDLDGSLARRAVAAGVTLSIDSDCHRAEALGRQMRFGVATARRGWIGPDHVLNTRDINAVRAFIAAKRARA